MSCHPFAQKEGDHIAQIVAEIVSAMSLNTVQVTHELQLTPSLRDPTNLQTAGPNDEGNSLPYDLTFGHQSYFIGGVPVIGSSPSKSESLYTSSKDTTAESVSSPSGGSMSHGSSTTWTSFEMKEYEQWQHMEARINHMFPPDRRFGKASPFVPRNIKEWIAHREAMDAAEAEKLRRKLAYSAQQKEMGNPERFQAKPFYGKQFGSFAQGKDGDALDASPNPPTRGAVLGQHTIWVGLNCPVAPPWRLPAQWPCKQEMEWEGDQRVATESVPWHLKPRVKPYAFDEIWRVPTEEDIIAPVDEIEDQEIIAQLLNKDLLDAIDNEP